MNMQISTENVAAAEVTPRKFDSSVTSTATSDINFFSSQFSSTGPSGLAASSTQGAQLLSERSSQLNTLSKRVTKGLRDISLNKNTQEMREITKSLSEAHQQLAISVKTINKTVQLVEKITNLQ